MRCYAPVDTDKLPKVDTAPSMYSGGRIPTQLAGATTPAQLGGPSAAQPPPAPPSPHLEPLCKRDDGSSCNLVVNGPEGSTDKHLAGLRLIMLKLAPKDLARATMVSVRWRQIERIYQKELWREAVQVDWAQPRNSAFSAMGVDPQLWSKIVAPAPSLPTTAEMNEKFSFWVEFNSPVGTMAFPVALGDGAFIKGAVSTAQFEHFISEIPLGVSSTGASIYPLDRVHAIDMRFMVQRKSDLSVALLEGSMRGSDANPEEFLDNRLTAGPFGYYDPQHDPKEMPPSIVFRSVRSERCWIIDAAPFNWISPTDALDATIHLERRLETGRLSHKAFVRDQLALVGLLQRSPRQPPWAQRQGETYNIMFEIKQMHQYSEAACGDYEWEDLHPYIVAEWLRDAHWNSTTI